jgi:RNA polymerase sigma-70 factor (ECF subfamily)
MRLVHDAEIAEDLAQEAFVRLWAAERDDRWPDIPRAWLSVVVSNLATSGFRRSAVARQHRDELGHVEGVRVGAMHAVVDAEFRADAREAVSTAIERLPADRRQAVLMAGAGYSASEIGEEMGRTPGAVRTLLCRARQVMRSELVAVIAG